MRPPANVSRETIAAVATPAGRGGIGVVRVSGQGVSQAIRTLVRTDLHPRQAQFARIFDAKGEEIDRGIALYFPGPHSYTGEDVVEFQAHGGPMVLQRILQACLATGCRIAEPGEFTLRAFLNGKMDLAQAESVADLIDAGSIEAARSAARSLSGAFSARIHQLVDRLIALRREVEARIDFPEEGLEPDSVRVFADELNALRTQLSSLQCDAKQGAVLREGLTVVLIGRPNVGKSSLLNQLAGEDLAIVTPVAGTTRDLIKTTIHIQGVPIHLVDTAGLRETDDEVESRGIARTWSAVEKAGAALLIAEAGEMVGPQEAAILAKLPSTMPVAWVYNKIDLFGQRAAVRRDAQHSTMHISALQGEGVDLVRAWLLEAAGWQPSSEGLFMARARHLDALRVAEDHLACATQQLANTDLFAEELRLTQNALNTITGEFLADDLLGEIFSHFCIGK